MPIDPDQFAKSMTAKGWRLCPDGHWERVAFADCAWPNPTPTQPSTTESSLHQDIIDFCNRQFPPWKFIRARMDKKSTIASGAQDFTIFKPGGVLLVECKRPTEKLSPDQLAWHKELQLLGYTVHLVRSFNDFLQLLAKP